MAPLVCRGLEITGHRRLLDGTAAAALRTNADLWRAHALALPLAFRAASEPLIAAGLKPLVFKGPALAIRYPESWLRPMEDIDLIVRPRDHARALRALTSAGWRPVQSLTHRRHDTLLAHPDLPGFPVELHTALDSWFEQATELDAGALWRRRRDATVLGTPVFIPDPEDELLAVAVHAGKPFHCFDKLIWSVDIALLTGAAAQPTLDWEAVIHRASQARCRTVLAVALALGRGLGGQAPAWVAPLPTGWRERALAPLLAPEWPLDPGSLRTRRTARYALADGWRQQARLFAGEHSDLPPRHQVPRTLDTLRRAGHRWWLLQTHRSARRLRRLGLVAAGTAVGMALRLLPVTSVWRSIDALARSVPSRRHAGDPVQIAAAVDAALRPPLRGAPGRCLQRSLLLYALLRRRGLHPQWTVGHLVEPDGRLVGHAWCSLDGRAVAEPPGLEAAYRPMLRRGG